MLGKLKPFASLPRPLAAAPASAAAAAALPRAPGGPSSTSAAAADGEPPKRKLARTLAPAAETLFLEEYALRHAPRPALPPPLTGLPSRRMWPEVHGEGQRGGAARRGAASAGTAWTGTSSLR